MANRLSMTAHARLALAAGAASLVAVSVGCLTTAAPTGLWARMLGVWVIGALLALALSRAPLRWSLPAALAFAALALTAALLGDGQGGVHRWIGLGPLNMNAAALTLPPAVVALAALSPGRRWPWALLALLLVLLILQPDASQTTALALAAAGILLRSSLPLWLRAAGALPLALAVAVVWMRPDPLAPVAAVEGVMGLAWAMSPLLAGLAVVALGYAALSPLAMIPTPANTPGRGLAVYLLATMIAPILGAFPLPLMGMSLAPVLGFWLGIGLVAAVGRQPA